MPNVVVLGQTVAYERNNYGDPPTKVRPPRVSPFNVTQSHQNRRGSIGYPWRDPLTMVLEMNWWFRSKIANFSQGQCHNPKAKTKTKNVKKNAKAIIWLERGTVYLVKHLEISSN